MMFPFCQKPQRIRNILPHNPSVILHFEKCKMTAPFTQGSLWGAPAPQQLSKHSPRNVKAELSCHCPRRIAANSVFSNNRSNESGYPPSGIGLPPGQQSRHRLRRIAANSVFSNNRSNESGCPPYGVGLPPGQQSRYCPRRLAAYQESMLLNSSM